MFDVPASTLPETMSVLEVYEYGMMAGLTYLTMAAIVILALDGIYFGIVYLFKYVAARIKKRKSS